MLGNTIAGAMSDDDGFYALFERALEHSGERYLRLPFGREHEKMIKSDVADVKNVGGGCCGTITAGLFIRSFCEGRPWLHLDIAGTAWCGSPTDERSVAAALSIQCGGDAFLPDSISFFQALSVSLRWKRGKSPGKRYRWSQTGCRDAVSGTESERQAGCRYPY